MSARPFETHNHAANTGCDRRLFNLNPVFKLQTSASEMTRAERFARSAGGGPCPH
jgi:hypothetical protein